jgi:hypothetical protein
MYMNKEHWAEGQIAMRNRILYQKLKVAELKLDAVESVNNSLLKKVADMADELEATRYYLHLLTTVENSKKNSKTW